MRQIALGAFLRRARRTVVAGGAALLLGAASVSGPLAPPVSSALAAPLTAPDPAAYEMAVFHLVNADRAASGLAPLSLDPSLVAIARWRSADMAALGYFGHAIGGVSGDFVFRVLDEQSVTYRVAGENLARTYAPLDESAALVEVALMESPTHRANILLPDFTHLGVGVATAPDGRTLYTQLFRQELPSSDAPTLISLLG